MGLDRRLVAVALCAAMQAGAAWAQAPAPSSDVGGRAALPRDAGEIRRDPMRALDITGDGSLDVAEAKSAAAARYDALNPALDERLGRQAAAPSLSDGEFQQADTDGNGVVNKAEYLAFVERRFGEADADKDGKLSRAELDGRASEPLLRTLR